MKIYKGGMKKEKKRRKNSQVKSVPKAKKDSGTGDDDKNTPKNKTPKENSPTLQVQPNKRNENLKRPNIQMEK